MTLALWAAADHGAVAWVTLDDYDNQPTVFWSYVVAALHRAGVAVPGVVPAAVPEEAVGHLFLRRLASALADQDPPVTLIIDDLHLLTESSVLDSLDYVLRNAGSGLRLVVTSRMDPLLPLHRYRLAGRLTEIRFGDLALSVPETGLLMAQHDIGLSADSLECLTQRTEGWAAGIRLAAISMTTHPDPDQFVKELIAEDSAVTGYLVDEALNTQPPEVRDLLVRTSVLERVSGDIAAEMAGHEHAAGILRAVAHANAFIQPVGHGWYRYHPLFAEVLRLKLRREYPEGIATWHYRAARWFERNGPLTDAVRHAAEAGDWKLAAGMVIDGLAIGEIIEPRGSRSLAGEFRGMPDSAASSELRRLRDRTARACGRGRQPGCPSRGRKPITPSRRVSLRLSQTAPNECFGHRGPSGCRPGGPIRRPGGSCRALRHRTAVARNQPAVPSGHRRPAQSALMTTNGRFLRTLRKPASDRLATKRGFQYR